MFCYSVKNLPPRHPSEAFQMLDLVHGRYTSPMNDITHSIEIFKPGTHITMGGVPLTFSEADVAATAAAYDPALRDAPLVVGHPAADHPAYGWAASAQFAGGVLTVTPKDVDPAFAEMVNAKRFPKISAAFLSPNDPNNPVPGVYYLRHVGFLGAMAPAVKGLRTPEFAEGEDLIIIEFGEGDLAATHPPDTTTPKESMMTPEQIAAKQAELTQQQTAQAEQAAKLAVDKATLEQQTAQFAERETALRASEAAARTADLTAFAEQLVSAGKVLPRDKEGLIAFMAASPAETIEFGEGDAKTKTLGLTWFKDEFLAKLPKLVEFGELAGPGKQAAAVDDATVARRARAYKDKLDQQGDNISFTEAVDAVSKNLDLVQS